MANRPFFMGEGGDEVDGMRNVAFLAAGIVIVVATGGPARAALPRAALRAVSRGRSASPCWKRLKMTMRNRVFLKLVAIVFATVHGLQPRQQLRELHHHLLPVRRRKTEASQGHGLDRHRVGRHRGVSRLPLNFISKRVGKTRTLLLAIGLMLGAQLSKVVCYDPDHPWLLVIPTVMLSCGMLLFFTLASAMVADVCDADELETGRRSEGSYYAVFWWFMKMGMAGAYFAAGLLFEATGFDEQSDVQSATARC
jgi:GPH family glycoside/pentoside/hexuronide:cation symporter